MLTTFFRKIGKNLNPKKTKFTGHRPGNQIHRAPPPEFTGHHHLKSQALQCSVYSGHSLHHLNAGALNRCPVNWWRRVIKKKKNEMASPRDQQLHAGSVWGALKKAIFLKKCDFRNSLSTRPQNVTRNSLSPGGFGI